MSAEIVALPIVPAEILRAYCMTLNDPATGGDLAPAYVPSLPDDYVDGDRAIVIQPIPSPPAYPAYLVRDRFYVRAYGENAYDAMTVHNVLWASLNHSRGVRRNIPVGGVNVKKIEYEQRAAITPDENGRIMAFATMALTMDVMQGRSD